MAESFEDGWERQYAAGRALNAYPFDIVVTLTARYFGGGRGAGLEVLDLGGGAGNHALFFARLGFRVTCVDVSPAALAVARRRFDQEGLTGRFCAMTFGGIDALDGTFDLVLDRGALSCADYLDLRTDVMPKIHRLLKPNALFFSCFLSKEEPVHGAIEPDYGYTRRDLHHPSGDDPLRLTRLDRTGVDELFERFTIVQLYHHRREELHVSPGEPRLGAIGEYIVVCRRTD